MTMHSMMKRIVRMTCFYEIGWTGTIWPEDSTDPNINAFAAARLSSFCLQLSLLWWSGPLLLILPWIVVKGFNANISFPSKVDICWHLCWIFRDFGWTLKEGGWNVSLSATNSILIGLIWESHRRALVCFQLSLEFSQHPLQGYLNTSSFAHRYRHVRSAIVRRWDPEIIPVVWAGPTDRFTWPLCSGIRTIPFVVRDFPLTIFFGDSRS